MISDERANPGVLRMSHRLLPADGIAILTRPRRAILGLLATEMTAGAIAEHFLTTRPAISQHLEVLLRAKLVSCRKDKTRRWYVTDLAALERLFLDTWHEVAP